MPKKPPIIRIYIGNEDGKIDDAYEDNSRQIPIWENDSKAGGKYLSGTITVENIRALMPNGKKLVGFWIKEK